MISVRSSVILVAVAAADAFAPSSLPLRTVQPRSRAQCSSTIVMQRSVGKPIDRKDGFGGGFDSIKEGIEKRSKDDWGGNGTGGASGKLGGGTVTSFEEYMKKRAAEAGGKVTDAAGNDITNAKPTYKVQEGAWGAPEDLEKDADPLEWVDKSVSGFGKADTSWLTEAVDDNTKKFQQTKSAEKEAQEAAIEAKMQAWLKAAAEKKAREGK